MEKIWITGARGHVGRALCKMLDQQKYQLMATDMDLDITCPEKVNAYVEQNRPDIIINCVGMNLIDMCEADPDHAYRTNALGARNLALAADKIGAQMVQMSTDDVFTEHRSQPYNEYDAPTPRTVYGRSKLAGEEFVKNLCRHYTIVRSCWVYGIGEDYVDTVLSAANDPACPYLMVPTDYIASPTSARELTKTIEILIDRKCVGTYHVVCPGHCSRYEFAREILRCAGLRKQLELKPTYRTSIASEYSVLDDMMLRVEGVPEPKEWKPALADYIKELLEKQEKH